MIESKVLRIYENDIPVEQLLDPMDQTLDFSQKVACYFADSFDDFVLDQIKAAAIKEGVNLHAAINIKELARMIKVYDNSEYVRVTRCEKCQHWKTLGVSIEEGGIGYCEKSGIIRPLDYFCASGADRTEWMKEVVPSDG